jgi:hypothetical protein
MGTLFLQKITLGLLDVLFFFRLASQEMAIFVLTISSCWNFGVLLFSALFGTEVHETTSSLQS